MCFPDVWVTVRYVDYGNHETLLLNRLRMLGRSFCNLPCQALSCFLAGITPANHGCAGKKAIWQDHIIYWLSKFLLGSTVEIHVVTNNESGQYGIDILVEKHLLESELLTCFPLSTEELQLLDLNHQGSVVRLTSFLCSSGFAEMVQCLNAVEDVEKVSVASSENVCSPTKRGREIFPVHLTGRNEETLVNLYSPVKDGNEVLPVHLNSGNEETLANLYYNNLVKDGNELLPVHLNSTNEETLTISECLFEPHVTSNIHTVPLSPQTSNQLIPLVVNLNVKSEIDILVSYVVSVNEFYVHPIQEDVAHSISSLSELLNHHFSKQRKHKLFPDNHIVCVKDVGLLCCVQSQDDKQWYRGVILTYSRSTKTCSVQLLDFGEKFTVPMRSVYRLENIFFCYPPLAVCCSLLSSDDNICPTFEYNESVCKHLMGSDGDKPLIIRVGGKY